jgi:hypothetical protein
VMEKLPTVCPLSQGGTTWFASIAHAQKCAMAPGSFPRHSLYEQASVIAL